MKTMMKPRINHLIAPVCAIILFAACSTPKDVAYFPEISNGTTFNMTDSKGITLKSNDKLSIVVNTKSAELNNALNMPVSTQIIGYSEVQSTNQSRATSGYTIDADGNIDFPLIGMVKAAGFTRAELANSLKRTLEEKNVAKDAVVTVEFLNVGFSVLGEVEEPGFYPFENDKTTLLQALGKAGDMTIFGNRNNVKVVRMNGDQQEVFVVDMLNTKELMKSPAYILQQNDVVYVEPNNYRKRQSTANASEITTASFWLSALSVLATISMLIFK
jgi:polysaccharide export outer membrane protein